MTKIGLFIAGAFAAQFSFAQVAVNTFGANDSYQTNSGIGIQGPTFSGGHFTEGCQFTSATTGTVTQIDVAAATITGPAKSIIFKLYRDSGTNTLGALLSTDTLTGLGQFGSANPILSYVPSTASSLIAGSKYWLVASAPGKDYSIWNLSPTTNTPWLYQETDTYYTYVPGGITGAFRLTTGVPEPSMLLAAPAFVLVARRRRKSASSDRLPLSARVEGRG